MRKYHPAESSTYIKNLAFSTCLIASVMAVSHPNYATMLTPPAANQPRSRPATVPAPVTRIMPVYELLGFLVLTVPAALSESLDPG